MAVSFGFELHISLKSILHAQKTHERHHTLYNQTKLRSIYIPCWRLNQAMLTACIKREIDPKMLNPIMSVHTKFKISPVSSLLANFLGYSVAQENGMYSSTHN